MAGIEVAYVIPVVLGPEDVPAWSDWRECGSRVVLIDNTPMNLWRTVASEVGFDCLSFSRNMGVATSWNLGARWAQSYGATHVGFVSSSVRWRGGLRSLTETFMRHGDRHRGMLTELSFHASIWNVELFRDDRAGRFDENFWPAYFEDNDWLRRLYLLGLHSAENPMPKPYVDATCQNAVNMRRASIYVPWKSLGAYYEAKWGGGPGEETYEHPFALGEMPVSWWPVLRGDP